MLTEIKAKRESSEQEDFEFTKSKQGVLLKPDDADEQ
jgi:hypothetical protein